MAHTLICSGWTLQLLYAKRCEGWWEIKGVLLLVFSTWFLLDGLTLLGILWFEISLGRVPL